MSATHSSPRGLSLRELLPNAQFHASRDVHVTACCGDSRVCSPGDLFVALDDSRHDGHDDALLAVAAGASAVLAERYLPNLEVPIVVVPDTRVAYGRLCQALAGHPSREVKVIGVTGTNGKTSVSCLIAAMLEQADFPVGLLNTLGYCDGREFESSLWPTPPAPVLAHWLARMRDNGCTHAVIEVGSEALLQSNMAGVELDAACITNIRQAPPGADGSLTQYRAAKARMLDCLSAGGFAVVNIDDPCVEGLVPKIRQPVLTVSLSDDAEVTATILERHRSEQTFLLSAGSDSIPVHTAIIGDGHVRNCLLAAAIGLTYGLDLPTIVRGLESVKRIPGRLERIECGQPFGVFVDESSTADRLATSLLTLRSVTPGRLICVTSMEQRKNALNVELAKASERMADVVVVTGQSWRNEHGADDTRLLLRGFEAPERVHLVRDRELAIRWALNEARIGDCVLITGDRSGVGRVISGHDREGDDRHVAKQWLYEQGAFLSPTEYR